MYDPCLNCESHSFRKKYYIKQFNRNIVICLKCGLMQANPRNDMLNFVDYEDLSEREDKLDRLFGLMKKGLGPRLKEIMEKEVETKRVHFRDRIRDIERHRKSGKLLDVGCAQGSFLSACLDSGFHLYGVEPSKYTYIEVLKNVPHSTIYNCTLLEARFPGDNFDAVTLINTLEHLFSPKETIAEVYRILKPGGFLMIETPNVDYWIPSLMGKRWIQFLIPDHTVFFSKSTLSGVLKEIGFEIQEVKSGNKTMSIRFLLFHLSRYLGVLCKPIMKIVERIGFADRTISIPQWDEMILFATKPK